MQSIDSSVSFNSYCAHTSLSCHHVSPVTNSVGAKALQMSSALSSLHQRVLLRYGIMAWMSTFVCLTRIFWFICPTQCYIHHLWLELCSWTLVEVSEIEVKNTGRYQGGLTKQAGLLVYCIQQTTNLCCDHSTRLHTSCYFEQSKPWIYHQRLCGSAWWSGHRTERIYVSRNVIVSPRDYNA